MRKLNGYDLQVIGIIGVIILFVLTISIYPPSVLYTDDPVEFRLQDSEELEEKDELTMSRDNHKNIRVKLANGFEKSDYTIKIYYIDEVFLDKYNEAEEYDVKEIEEINGSINHKNDFIDYSIETNNSVFTKIEIESYNYELKNPTLVNDTVDRIFLLLFAIFNIYILIKSQLRIEKEHYD